MRTCPACGEDTEAGYAEPCSECGFSPLGEQAGEPTAAETEPAATIGEQPVASEPTEARKKRPAVRGLVWLVVIAAAIGVDRLGVFDQPPGPDPDRVEEAIVDDARQHGAEVTVDCPDDADQTEVEASFRCTVTNAEGRAARIVVVNHEDTFSWQSGPLSRL